MYRWIVISTVNLVPYGFLLIVLMRIRTCSGFGVLNYLTKTTVSLLLLLPLLSRDNGTLINQLALMQLPWTYFETPGDQESVLGQKGRETIALCACQLWLSEECDWASTPGWGNMPNRRYSLYQPQPTHGDFRGQTRHT